MELSIGLPEGLLLKLSGGKLTLFEKDWTTVRRQIDLSILEGAPIADITWSHKLWAAVVAALAVVLQGRASRRGGEGPQPCRPEDIRAALTRGDAGSGADLGS